MVYGSVQFRRDMLAFGRRFQPAFSSRNFLINLWTKLFVVCLLWPGICGRTVYNSHRLSSAQTTGVPRYFDVPIDAEDRYHLYWLVDEDEGTITMEIRASLGQSDWFGFGFSDNGDVSDADLCVMWIDRHGRPHFQDTWTDAAGVLSVDYHNDCDVIGLKRRGRIVRFVLRRKIDTCDDQDYVIEDGTTHVVYVTGKGPLRRLDGKRITKEEHGFQRVQLLKNTNPIPELEPSVETISVTNDQVRIPADETTYWCSLHQLPESFSNKHHIVKYEAAIQKGNEALVHHMEVFHCEVSTEMILPEWNGLCRTSERPVELDPCKRVLAAWAMGAPPLAYPEEAGLPMGGSNFSRYVMLEVHYNNPELKSDWIDSSGVRFYYTANLRKYDAGVLEVGLEYTDKMAIPPKQLSFDLSGYCVAECTRASLPPEGINVFASQLHTHLVGAKVVTKHVRGGVELPELNRDNHYSTHFQEIRALKRRVNILPGDALITTCSYDTTERVNITLGGYAISDEMCVNYIHYFPKTNLEVCKSSIDSHVLRSYFLYMNKYNNEPTSDSQGVGENYKSITWSQNNADFLYYLYQSAPLSMQCNQSSGERFPGYWNGIPLTTILYEQPKKGPHLPQCDKEHESFDSSEEK